MNSNHLSKAAPASAPLPTFEQFTAIRRFQGTLAFSPDASEVAYSVNTSGQFNLWRQSSDGGYPHQVTLSSRQSVRELSWSPDGNTFAFTADQDGDEFTKVYLVPSRGGQPVPVAVADQVQYSLLGWSPNGQLIAYAGNDREPANQDVIVWNVETGSEHRIMATGGLLFPASWSPDSARMLVIDAHSNTNVDIHVVEVETGASRLLTPHEGEITYYPVGWTADSSGFYFLSDEDREFTALGLFHLESGTREWIETPDWDIELAVTSQDGRRLVWAVNEDGYSRLFTRDL
ncbi:MAG TPA: hypothetical protein VFQ54_05670, partial [Thermomicrobiales bacterium]|nr:hypothetical protein [Thermomicrobiales bacterium]